MTTHPRSFAVDMDAALPQLLALLERAVNIDSGSYHAAGVNAFIDLVAAELRGLGFVIERRPLPGRGDQMTARRHFGGRRKLLILGHADTVWPAGTAAEWPFARSGDRITGPGVGDMKGGVITALFALRASIGSDLSGLGECAFLLVPDEELGSVQSRAWIEEEARGADACLTLEPCRPGGGVVTARGAVGAVFVRAKGLSAHCATAPEKGASAIRALAGLIPELEALSHHERGISASVGIFQGGAARQVVPPDAKLHLDLRAPDAVAAQALLDGVGRIVNRPLADRRVSLTLEGGISRPAFPRGTGTVALFRLAETICAELGAPIFEVTSRGGSDGSFAAALGVPTLDGLGPISHDTCGRRETVEVSTIALRGALLGSLIAVIASGHPLPRE
ncbi:MAG TPA: M20 family metallopeptidase [Stellaceae bacterium]|nr:M20 family metallopeptidase [Stellaceae bacterium]